MSSASTGQGQLPESAQKLVSWKSIGNYFDCDERTAKRWERERGLPVHRAPGGKRSAVFAYSWELDSWLRTGMRESDPGAGIAPHGNAARSQCQPAAAIEAEPVAQRPRTRRWPMTAAAVVVILLAAAVALVIDRRQAAADPTTMRPASDRREPAPAPAAEDLYLQGRYFWSLRTADSLSKAIDAYTQAIVKDPSYAEAYAGLAESYDLLPQFAHENAGEAFTRAKDAANRAIALNPNLAAAHRAKAFALFFWDWDIAASDAEFQRALALDPRSAETHQWYASTLLNRGEGAACMREIDEALRLSPASAAIATDAALMHEEFGNDPGGSMRRLRALEQTQPTLLTPGYFLKTIDFTKGDYPAYLDDLHRIAAVTRNPHDLAMAAAATRGWARGGKVGMLEEIAQEQKKAVDRGTGPGFDLGQTYLLLGRPRQALPYFKASLDQHFILVMTMPDCSWAKKLSADKDYAALLAQIRGRIRGGQTAPLSAVPVVCGLPE